MIKKIINKILSKKSDNTKMIKKAKAESLPEEEQKTAKKQEGKSRRPAPKKKIPVQKPKQEPELQEEFEDLIELQPNFDESDVKVWNEKHIDQQHSHTHTYERKNYGQNRQQFHKKKSQGSYGKKTNDSWNQPKPLVWREGSDDPDRRPQHKPFNKNKPFVKNKPFRKDNTQGQDNNTFGKSKTQGQHQGFKKNDTQGKAHSFGKDNQPGKAHSFGKDNQQGKSHTFSKDNQQGQNNTYGKNKFNFKKKKDNRSWEERKPKFWNEGKSNKRYLE